MTHTGRASEIEQGPFELEAFIISLVGDFDIAERARLLDAFAIATSAAVVVIDLKKTRYLDSTVLECIVALRHAVAERGARLVLVGLSPDIRRIFEICNLERLLEIRPSLGDVTNELSGDAPRLRRLSLIAEPLETTKPPPN
ncbi:MAG TPA: STAS domain-containing protein [Candidatus Binatia bacterium]|nr:STAS domain-containing protein [Candidatus Binatia bacterium]